MLLLLFLSSQSEMILHIFSLGVHELPEKCAAKKYERKKYPRSRVKIASEQFWI
jgi:hypothetical protein